MREKIVAGNWKMQMDLKSGAELIQEIKTGSDDSKVRVVLCPPFVLLDTARTLVKGTTISIGAQNVHEASQGAYTGEISPSMLVSVGCSHVIVGHSERRQYYHETDDLINRKAKAALSAGLKPIICFGETLEQRDGGQTQSVVIEQVNGVLDGFTMENLESTVLAYEPVWAIGTGRTASPAQAQEVHGSIRTLLRQSFGSVAERVPILYGGSVKPDNAFELFSQPDIDGGLIGGASLKADDFLKIIHAAGQIR